MTGLGRHSSRGEWVEVGERCFARRYEPFDISVGVVLGADGVLVIDTRGCVAEGRELQADLRLLTPRRPRWIVNTHWHCDHCFGNAAFDPGVAIFGHESVPAMLTDWGADVKTMLAERSPEYAAEMAGLVIVPPNETFTTENAIDIGHRLVELVHPGRGHTAGDIVVRVPEADVVFAGDLIKSSAPPAYSPGSFPLDWPEALERVSGLLTRTTTVVPGHGPVVDREFVMAQRLDVNAVAQGIRQLWTSGVPESAALGQGKWPFPDTYVADAVSRGYAALRVSGGACETGV